MKKILLFSVVILIFSNCEVNDNTVTITLPEMGLNIEETTLASWLNPEEETSVTYTNLLQEPANAGQLRYSKYLGFYIDDDNQFGWIDVDYNIDSVFLILDLEYPLPNTEGRSVFIQLIRKEALNYLSLDAETDTYSYNDPEDFKDRFLRLGAYDEGDHYAKLISTEFESDYPDYGNYALGFPGLQNEFEITKIWDTELGIIVSGTCKGKCYMFSCGYAEVSKLENGTFNAFIGI